MITVFIIKLLFKQMKACQYQAMVLYMLIADHRLTVTMGYSRNCHYFTHLKRTSKVLSKIWEPSSLIFFTGKTEMYNL